MTTRQSKALVLVVLLGLGSGCYVYRQDVRQGNFMSDSALEQLQVGMSRAQVEFLLGKPMVADPFHPDRWDFVYLLEVKGREPERRHISVLFEGDAVREIRR